MLVAPNGGQVMGAYPKALLAIITSQSVIAILLISLRVRDATLRNKGWKWDLKLAVLSTVLATIHQYVFVLLALLNGLGMPESGLSLHQVQSNLLWSWISIYITLYAVLFAKLAMVAMYLDITQAASRIERMSLWIISILLTITTLVQFVILLTPCNPVEKLWFFELPGKCSGLSRGMAFSYFAGGQYIQIQKNGPSVDRGYSLLLLD
ncbi:hypothetical protein ANO11243_077010 [Dothideomycetidae sp. 11243]|nr:hypothetical protein ANO11243_077010 [fungal sp. No.11243]